MKQDMTTYENKVNRRCFYFSVHSVFLTFTCVSLGDGAWLPWLLVVTWTTLVTVLSTGVVFTHTLQLLFTHTHTHRLKSMETFSSPVRTLRRCRGEQVCRYLGNWVQRAALGVAVTDTHPAHRDVFDGVIILRT